MSLALFAYGSLVSAHSAAETLGREVEVHAASLRGWRRSWTLARDNRACEKTFSRPDGSVPDVVLALNLEPGANAEVNGALIAVEERDLSRLDVREIRYERIDVTSAVTSGLEASPARAYTYVARPENFAASMPPGAVILASYERAVEDAFSTLGELDRFRASTAGCAAERIEPVLVTGTIPPGNPTGW